MNLRSVRELVIVKQQLDTKTNAFKKIVFLTTKYLFFAIMLLKNRKDLIVEKAAIKKIVIEVLQELGQIEKVKEASIDRDKLIKTLKLLQTSSKKRQQTTAIPERVYEMRGVESLCDFLIRKIESGDLNVRE